MSRHADRIITRANGDYDKLKSLWLIAVGRGVGLPSFPDCVELMKVKQFGSGVMVAVLWCWWDEIKPRRGR